MIVVVRAEKHITRGRYKSQNRENLHGDKVGLVQLRGHPWPQWRGPGFESCGSQLWSVPFLAGKDFGLGISDGSVFIMDTHCYQTSRAARTATKRPGRHTLLLNVQVGADFQSATDITQMPNSRITEIIPGDDLLTLTPLQLFLTLF
jgi:hypothetical protein